jgi:Transposase DDE domain group 1
MKLAKKRRRVAIGCDDPKLTPHAGLALIAEVDRVLGLVSTIDTCVGSIKSYNRGQGAGGLLVSAAEMMLGGGDFMCDLDNQRKDTAGRELRAVPQIPSSPTFIALTKQFDEWVFEGIERANAALVRRWFGRLDAERRVALVAGRPTIDLDPTDVEVYGNQKQGVAYNYQGQRCGRPHPAVWAEAGVVLCADLGSGKSDPRPQAPSLIKRSVAALPKGLLRPIIRADSGFFDRGVANAALDNDSDFAIVAKRSTATLRTARNVPEDAWERADGMDAEVAPCEYVPAGWPPGTHCVVRRVRVKADEISTDPRSRRRKTIDPDQLRLCFDGDAEFAYAYSFIVTNLDWPTVEIEKWFRMRALVEERIKDTKLGMALRHLPSGYEATNRTWMWAAIFATNISVWLQSLAEIDDLGRAHGKRLRRELLNIPARVLHRGRSVVLRFASTMKSGPFLNAWDAMRARPTFVSG